MNIFGTNPQNGNPIFNVGEYKDVLPMEQTLNYENIDKYVKAAVNNGSEAELDAAIENVFKQPIMAEVYRKAGIKPEMVDDYIKSRLELPHSAKTTLMINLGAPYHTAANDMESEIDTPRISGDREWLSLETRLKASANITVPMKSFAKQKSEEKQPAKPQKSNLQKLLNIIGIKKDGRKL